MKRLHTGRVLTVLIAGVALVVPSSVPAQRTDRPVTTVHTGNQLLDLNSASPEQLRALPGMGDAYVRRIIEGRPYTAKNQLSTRGVLPQQAYERIRDLVVARRHGER